MGGGGVYFIYTSVSHLLNTNNNQFFYGGVEIGLNRKIYGMLKGFFFCANFFPIK